MIAAGSRSHNQYNLLFPDNWIILFLNTILTSVCAQMVGFGSEQGLSNFETDGVAVPALAGIAGYVEDFKRAKTPLRTKRCRLWMGTN
jgi:hypothetical protein